MSDSDTQSIAGTDVSDDELAVIEPPDEDDDDLFAGDRTARAADAAEEADEVNTMNDEARRELNEKLRRKVMAQKVRSILLRSCATHICRRHRYWST